MHVERELKFRLAAASASRVWSLIPDHAPASRRVLESVYYDTPERRLRAARAALRLRRDGRRWLICFKHDRAPASGLAQRSEWETPVGRGALTVSALPLAEICACAGLDLRMLAPRLMPVFSTRFARRSSLISLKDGTRIELCVDRGIIAAGRRRAPIRELELELAAGDLGAMLEFAERLVEPLRLELEPLSKAERGYRLAAGERAAPIKARPPSFGENESTESVLLAVVQASLEQIEGNVEGVAQASAPEYLHQLRVGLRRLGSAWRSFEDLGPRKAFRAPTAALKDLMPVLGKARDWDVFCLGLRRPALVRRANATHARARRAAQALARSARMQRFLLGVVRWMHESPWRRDGKAARPAAAFVGRMLARLERRLRHYGDEVNWDDASQRHRLRIRVKRLRYACEPFATLYEGAAVKRYLRRLEALQEILGELNDIAVGRRLLSEIRLGRDERAPVLRSYAARERRLVAHLEPAWRAWRKSRSPW
ncbi:MAG: CHAD domain-containing protein [Sphingomonadaceae bacterium]